CAMTAAILSTHSVVRAEVSGEVSLVMVGDVLMHMPVVNAGKQADGSLDYDVLFEEFKDDIESADIAIVNQETILGGEELMITGYPSFNSPYEVGDAEVRAGFDVILQGSNHALDRSAKGIFNCLGYWEEKHPGIEVLGIHDSAEDQNRICVIEKNGIRISILNYTYGTNGIQMPSGMGYLVDYLSEARVRTDIRRAGELSDFIVVCPHWGTEYKLGISDQQEKWTDIFLSEGVDLVIGTHPHVIEPVVWKTDGDGHKMLVYYSLGNFVNSTSGTGEGVMNRMLGGMAQVCIKKDPGERAYVAGSGVIPVVCHLEENSVKAYHIKDYSNELAQRNRIRLQDPDFSYQSVRNLARNVWPFYEIKRYR
ncbi:MAG: CapA family protein, partial [Lachnospiraceae bacterium]|nr:CapA family protein [Lachnospiraceae bacterium]